MSLKISHNAGFFSCCSVKLNKITDYINEKKQLPEHVDSSEQFELYKINKTDDITFDYFEHYNNKDIEYPIQDKPIDYWYGHQFIDYNKLEYTSLCPLVNKYFSPSTNIKNKIEEIKQKYNLDYNNICVLFYRGNDKATEIKLCGYDEYINNAKLIIKRNPEIQFLIQSDETQFIETMLQEFPTNSFYFKDETRNMKKYSDQHGSVDYMMATQNNLFSKYFLAITIIMSQCKYVVCISGNCSLWIILYRGNCKGVYQYLSQNVTIKEITENKWIVNEN